MRAAAVTSRSSRGGRLALGLAIGLLLPSCDGSGESSDAGSEADGDLPWCVAHGPIGIPRASCPTDLPPEDDCPTASPFYADVAPIFEARCSVCHGAAGLETKYRFDTYAAVHDDVAVRTRIITQIYSCRMPPSCAPNLSPDERRTMLKWLVCNAPESADAGVD